MALNHDLCCNNWPFLLYLITWYAVTKAVRGSMALEACNCIALSFKVSMWIFVIWCTWSYCIATSSKINFLNLHAYESGRYRAMPSSLHGKLLLHNSYAWSLAYPNWLCRINRCYKPWEKFFWESFSEWPQFTLNWRETYGPHQCLTLLLSVVIELIL